MTVWQLDTTRGLKLLDGTPTEIVACVDRNARSCVFATVSKRATEQMASQNLERALNSHAAPHELQVDHCWRLSDESVKNSLRRVCRSSDISMVATRPLMPRDKAKTERFFGELHRALEPQGPFVSQADVQAAVDLFVARYNEFGNAT